MNRKLIIILFLILLLVIFTLQNSFPAEIRLFFWKLSCPLSLLLVIIFIAGVIVGFLAHKPAGRKEKAGPETDQNQVSSAQE